MSASKPNEYDWRGTRTSWRQWKRALKRQTARLARRRGKTLGEDCPKRHTVGWVR